jgi:hypothetical protein
MAISQPIPLDKLPIKPIVKNERYLTDRHSYGTGDHHVTPSGLRVEYCQHDRRVTRLNDKTSKKNTYTDVTLSVRLHELFIYAHSPSVVYRNNPRSGDVPIAVFQRNRSGEWFPVAMPLDCELTSLRSFPGAIGLDLDAAIVRGTIKTVGKPAKRPIGRKPTPKNRMKHIRVG